MEKLVLIDGHSILNRAFYGVPDLTNAEGLHTNAVYGFLNIMFKILEEEQADHLAVAFDLPAPTFRHKMYGDYKGTRKPMPEELREQVPLMQEVLAAMGIPILTLEGYEADDILGTVAKRSQAAGVEVSVVSGDRDLLQLADAHIKIRIPKTSRGSTEIYDYYPEDVKAQYQVTPAEFIDVKALMGDASDNIPGVPSIGEKTATAIIAAFGSIENARAHLDEVKPPRARKALEEHYDMAQMSKELAAICTDCPVEFRYEDARIENLYTPEAFREMKRLGFKTFLSRFDASVREAEDGPGIQAHFKTISNEKEAGKLFEKAMNCPFVGFQLLGSSFCREKEPIQAEQMTVSFSEAGEVLSGTEAAKLPGLAGAALTLGEEEIYCLRAGDGLSEEFLREQSAKLLERRTGPVWVLDLKALLHLLEFAEKPNVFDAGVAGYLLDPLGEGYDYDQLSRGHIGLSVPSRTELLGKEDAGDALARGEEKAAACACYMGYAVWKAGPVLLEKLADTGMDRLYREIEMPLIYSLYHMEKEGVKVEREELAAYGARLKEGIARLEKEIYADTGREFNINSPKQLGEILFGEMKLPGGKKTKTGYSTAADVLEKLAPDHPVIRKILDYRQLTKLSSTYAEGLAAFIQEDGRIHGRFNQTITATGRISSTEPNLQNIPVRLELGRELRRVFVPSSEEFCFLDADYSQIELRVLAHIAGDETLIDAFRHQQDIHRLTASQVFHVPFDEVTPLQRSNAKAVNFGIVYGIGSFSLSQDLGITRKEAEQYIAAYFTKYPKIKEYQERMIKEATEQGYVSTIFHRRRAMPELQSGNFVQRSFGERVAMNMPIQGSAADIIKIAMVKVHRALKEGGFRSRLILQVHDELLIETALEEKEAVAKILKENMEQAVALSVPLDVDVHEGQNWLDAK